VQSLEQVNQKKEEYQKLMDMIDITDMSSGLVANVNDLP
jgi:hypothetical protein